jgi:Amt family ammonium transporter
MSLIIDGVDLDALNYTVKVPYNGTIMTGGDSLNADLNVFYDVSIPRRAVQIRVEQKLT